MILLELLKEFWGVVRSLGGAAKELWRLLRVGWKALLRLIYEELTGMAPEEQPTLLQVLVELKIAVSELPKKKRIAAYTGGVAVVLVVCLAVGTAVTPVIKGGDSSGGSGSGGSRVTIGNHKYYQPEFSKLDCLTCGGDGDCNTCRGYGEVERYAGAGDTVRSKCSSCYGSGNCRTCGGSGKR